MQNASIYTLDAINEAIQAQMMYKGYRFDHTKGVTCCICGGTIPLVVTPDGCETTIGQNNPRPIAGDSESVCCATCNNHYVIPARLGQHYADAGMLLALANRMRMDGCAEDSVRRVVDLADEAIIA